MWLITASSQNSVCLYGNGDQVQIPCSDIKLTKDSYKKDNLPISVRRRCHQPDFHWTRSALVSAWEVWRYFNFRVRILLTASSKKWPPRANLMLTAFLEKRLRLFTSNCRSHIFLDFIRRTFPCPGRHVHVTASHIECANEKPGKYFALTPSFANGKTKYPALGHPISEHPCV